MLELQIKVLSIHLEIDEKKNCSYSYRKRHEIPFTIISYLFRIRELNNCHFSTFLASDQE